MASDPPTYRVGDTVDVVRRPATGHVRTPRYVQEHRGRITSIHGRFPDPESLAHQGDGTPPRWLYELTFDATALWGPSRGVSGDSVRADVFEHWLRTPDEGAQGDDR